jgi:hypothetical protein
MATLPGRNIRNTHSVRAQLARKAERERYMTISPVGGAAQSYLSQLYSTQQTQAASAVSVDAAAANSVFSSASTLDASAGNSLSGTSSSTLDSQTLQALLDLTQQDPTGTDPSQQGGQTGQATGAHHHHHHHGSGAASSTQTPSSPATTTTGAASPSAAATTEEQDADASLESALLTA